jgi:hypothetical protein
MAINEGGNISREKFTYKLKKICVNLDFEI